MKKIFQLIALFALTGFSTIGNAQTNKSNITGAVKDETQKGIEAATVSLLAAKDSSALKFSVTDKNGKFQFENIPSGKYLVAVTAAGHVKTYSENIGLDGSQPSVDLKAIALKPAAKGLAGVTVTASRPFIEQKIDRTVVNVEASVTNAGSTALDVLEKSPGVTVDKDGNISLKGKQGIMVMMDGRPSYLSAAELSNYLKNLPATAIDQIEIMTNPSAKYDAAGNAGIINIKTKKNKQKGFNGSLTTNYGQGKYWKNNNSLNLNYRTGKLNLFANANQSEWNGFQTLDINRKFKNTTTKEVSAIFDQTSLMLHSSTYSSLKIGADYYVNKKTTIGLVTSGFLNPETNSSANTSYLKNSHGQTDSIAFAESHNKNKWKNGSVNLNLRHQFDSTGRELTADIDRVSYNSKNSQTYSSTSYHPDWVKKGVDRLRGDLPVTIDIYSAKVDYAHPLKKGAKLELGAKSSYVQTDNAANYFIVAPTSESIDYDKTNHFNYKENINAAYVNYNKQTGLRFENTAYEGRQYGNPTRNDSSFKKSYSNLFPTVFVSYAANKKNQFALSFGRRIDRAAYQDMNPFMFFIDNYTYESGNPFLKPQFSNNIELTHTFKSILTTSINYGLTKDFIGQIFEQTKSLNGSDDLATIVRRGNIGKRNSAGLSVSAQVPVKKWWTSILYTNVNYNKFSGWLGDEYLDIEATNLMVNVNNQFKFNKGWSAELSGWYRTKGLEGQIIIQPMSQASIGVSKQVIKNKGTLRLNVKDMFYTNYAKGTIKFDNTEAYFENRRDSRVANLSFSYRFGKPIKDQRQKRKIGGADDEQGRVKVGGGN
jgi:outer membrane receptor protein involved in Fe transport